MTFIPKDRRKKIEFMENVEKYNKGKFKDYKEKQKAYKARSEAGRWYKLNV